MQVIIKSDLSYDGQHNGSRTQLFREYLCESRSVERLRSPLNDPLAKNLDGLATVLATTGVIIQELGWMMSVLRTHATPARKVVAELPHHRP
jgi:hypothetical protein